MLIAAVDYHGKIKNYTHQKHGLQQFFIHLDYSRVEFAGVRLGRGEALRMKRVRPGREYSTSNPL